MHQKFKAERCWFLSCKSSFTYKLKLDCKFDVVIPFIFLVCQTRLKLKLNLRYTELNSNRDNKTITSHLNPLSIIVPMNCCCCSSSTMILFDSRPCSKFKFKQFLINSPPSFGIQIKPSFKFNRDHHRQSSCKAVFADDALFTAAIGACMLTSLLLPVPVATEEEEESSLTSTDTRLAVMGIMSFKSKCYLFFIY